MGSNPIGASEFFWALSYFTTAKISFTSVHVMCWLCPLSRCEGACLKVLVGHPTWLYCAGCSSCPYDQVMHGVHSQPQPVQRSKEACKATTKTQEAATARSTSNGNATKCLVHSSVCLVYLQLYNWCYFGDLLGYLHTIFSNPSAYVNSRNLVSNKSFPLPLPDSNSPPDIRSDGLCLCELPSIDRYSPVTAAAPRSNSILRVHQE